jgi:hypothetical protein
MDSVDGKNGTFSVFRDEARTKMSRNHAKAWQRYDIRK